MTLKQRLKCAWRGHEYWTGLDDRDMPKVECKCGNRVMFDVATTFLDQIALQDARKHIKAHGSERWYAPGQTK